MLRAGEGVKAKKGYRPCRTTVGCVHARCLLTSVCEANEACVDGNCQWTLRRAQNSTIDKQQFLRDIPLPGHPSYQSRAPKHSDGRRDMPEEESIEALREMEAPSPRQASGKKRAAPGLSLYQPFSPEQLAEIDKGVHRSEVYRPPFEVVMEAKRKAQLDLTAGGTSKRRATAVLDRGYKIQDLLDGPTCACVWCPAQAQWAKRCDECQKTKVAYLYDRGLTRVSPFTKEGIDVFVPSRKQKGQVVWTKQTAERDRSIAQPRVNIERNNRELRRFDGFHSTMLMRASGLADDEAQVARGMCNQRPALMNWLARSASGFEFD